MPARLDQVSVTTSRVKAFGDVGATRPVTLSAEERAILFEAIQAWSHRVTVDKLPPGIWRLRCAIAEDLHYDPA